jgi:hypothetical protein
MMQNCLRLRESPPRLYRSVALVKVLLAALRSSTPLALRSLTSPTEQLRLVRNSRRGVLDSQKVLDGEIMICVLSIKRLSCFTQPVWGGVADQAKTHRNEILKLARCYIC